jgi:antitoxin component YwqK of YwqJK toxin-antitoxin module
MKINLVFSLVVLCSVTSLFSQKINDTDANGLRQGVWEKKFPGTQQLRYTGQFKDGKEVGTFTFYCEDCGTQPFCIKKFNSEGKAEVSFFSKDGDLVSKGQMQGKKRIGEWVAFHEKSDKVLTREYFEDGKLQGVRTIYTPKGAIIETVLYVNGLKEGISTYFSPDGVLLKEVTYQNDLLHGPAVYFSATGIVTMKGNYKYGRNHGVWKYYKNGIFLFDETFPEPEEKN